MITVACVWNKSDIYDSKQWVLRLWSMVNRWIGCSHYPFRFVCITKHYKEFLAHPEVETATPTIIPPKGKPGHWWKVNLFNLGEDHERILYFDLDVVIMSGLGPMIDFPSDFVVSPSSGMPMRGHDFNSSVMMWNPSREQAKMVAGLLKQVPFDRFAGDQQWLSSLPMRVDLFPSRWVSKYLSAGGVKKPDDNTIVSLLIQGGKNQALIDSGHTWISDYWR